MVSKKLLFVVMLPPVATGVFFFLHFSDQFGFSPTLLAIPAALILLLLLVGYANAKPKPDPRLALTPSVQRGRADLIKDPGDLPWQWVMEALKILPEDESTPDNPAWDYEYSPDGEALGLRSTHSSGEYDSAIYMIGKRHGRQIKVRMGKREGIAHMPLGRKNYREITLLRAELPSFEIVGQEGALKLTTDAPKEVTKLIGSLSHAPTVWHKLRIVAGPEGIVATRPTFLGRSKKMRQESGRWLYDLWLLERIVELLQAPPLPATPVKELAEDDMPYRIGRWTG